MDFDIPGTVSKGALMIGAVWIDQRTLCSIVADSEEFELALPPCCQDSQSTRGLINHGICSFLVAVRWRNGLPSASVLGSIPGVAAMSEHFALSTDPCLARSEIKAVGKTTWEVLIFLPYLCGSSRP